MGLPTAPGNFDGRSDYAAFMDHGIPSGGLFTGAESIKTAKQAELFGGVIGVCQDPCYHQVLFELIIGLRSCRAAEWTRRYNFGAKSTCSGS